MERVKVVEEKIKVLTVTVLRGRGITVGISDIFDTPDPYVKLRVLSSPNAKQKTSSKEDDTEPEWNETFLFYLNSEKKNTLELIIMDEDFGFDDIVGRETVELDDLPMDEEKYMEIQFKEKTFLDVKLRVTYDESKALRYSYDLCDEEKSFVSKRKEKILGNLSKVLKENQMPKSVDEVPIIAIMGSGGGYRAMCGLSGVFCALQETGILDCATYVTGLSGSSWYISTLFSHEGWPSSIGCDEFAKDLRKKFNSSILSHFKKNFTAVMREKRNSGQPVTLTDLFGMAIGDALLDNKSAKLSHQAQKVKFGDSPLPICTGLRVRENVSARKFSEWLEFSPFEFGLANYGVFGKTPDFGGKFYKGRLVKKFDEVPLSYLQGIWGSAFSILLNRVVGHDTDEKKAEEEALGKTTNEETELAREELMYRGVHREKDEDEDSEDGANVLEEGAEDEIGGSCLSWLKEAIKPSNLFNSRMGKAAEVLNMCRGLKLKSENDNEVLVHHYGGKKTMCLVDSGLAFNSPYPTLVRVERKVDLILSFDFSQRYGGDNGMPFDEILAAEKWARENNLPFPPVAANPAIRDKDIRECYVFEDPDDPRCPTILHFVLINKTFKDYVAPGKPRVTKKEKDFANFSIFDNPDEPYSSFKFSYDHQTYDRLHELMLFNTLLNVDLIKETIASQVRHQ